MAKGVLNVTSWLVPPSTQVSHFLAADNQLVIADGVDLSYQLGTMRKDLGYASLVNTMQTSPIYSLACFTQSPSVQKVLATRNAGSATVIDYASDVTGGSWSTLSPSAWNAVTDQLVESDTFLGYQIFVGANAAASSWLPVASLTNTTFSTSTNVTGMPQARYICRFRDRMYVANLKVGSDLYPYRVAYSDVPTAGSLTWTPADDFFDVDFGSAITGMAAAFNRLLVFTVSNVWVYDQITLSDARWPGCLNSRSIQVFDAYAIWANTENVWVSTGGRPQAMGNDILELLRNSDASKWRSANSYREYHLYLGATRANGIDYQNCLASLSMQTGMWRWRELAVPMSAACQFLVNGSGRQYLVLGGEASGKVYRKCYPADPAATLRYSDDGAPIMGWFRTKAYDFGDPSVRKEVTRIISYCEDAQALDLRFRVFDKNREPLMTWQKIGALTATVNVFDQSLSGYFIQFEGKEYSSNPPFRFYGLSALVGPDTKIA